MLIWSFLNILRNWTNYLSVFFGFCLWENETGGTYGLTIVFPAETFWPSVCAEIRLSSWIFSCSAELWPWIRSDFFCYSAISSPMSFLFSASALLSWFYSKTLSLRRVIALMCSLGFISVLLGNDPYGLLASKFDIWPIWTPRLWIGRYLILQIGVCWSHECLCDCSELLHCLI